MDILNESLVRQLVRSNEKYNTFEKVMTLILTLFYQNQEGAEKLDMEPASKRQKTLNKFNISDTLRTETDNMTYSIQPTNFS